jgi:transcriptional regulator NrdR family protein
MDISKCEKCGGDMIAIDTRHKQKFLTRRRKCTVCGHRITTVEVKKEDIISKKEYDDMLVELDNIQVSVSMMVEILKQKMEGKANDQNS